VKIPYGIVEFDGRYYLSNCEPRCANRRSKCLPLGWMPWVDTQGKNRLFRVGTGCGHSATEWVTDQEQDRAPLSFLGNEAP
jgi:hypothetical protein